MHRSGCAGGHINRDENNEEQCGEVFKHARHPDDEGYESLNSVKSNALSPDIIELKGDYK
jgi:hypothetical protein